MSPIIRFEVRNLTADERELFEERAAIMEFEARLSREDAEKMALEDVLRIREAKKLLEAA